MERTVAWILFNVSGRHACEKLPNLPPPTDTFSAPQHLLWGLVDIQEQYAGQIEMGSH